jgi:probable rRNA maturation factor
VGLPLLSFHHFYFCKMPISFHQADVKFHVAQARALKAFLMEKIEEAEPRTKRQGPGGKKQETRGGKQIKGRGRLTKLRFIFCSDEFLLNINRQHLNHDYYTDIITFPLMDSPELLEAEIYISIDRVRENAERFKAWGPLQKSRSITHNLNFSHELHRVIFHGVLHLLGHTDKTKRQQMTMRAAEDAWLKGYFG